MQNVVSFIVETAKLQASLVERDGNQIKGLQASLPSLSPEYRTRIELGIQMGSLAFVALDAPKDAQLQILQLSALIAELDAEHRSSGRISSETVQAIIDGMAATVLAVKNSYLDNSS